MNHDVMVGAFIKITLAACNMIGSKKGRGTVQLVFDNGDAYDGEVVDGKADGYGTYTCANGDIYEGRWKNDALISGPTSQREQRRADMKKKLEQIQKLVGEVLNDVGEDGEDEDVVERLRGAHNLFAFSNTAGGRSNNEKRRLEDGTSMEGNNNGNANNNEEAVAGGSGDNDDTTRVAKKKRVERQDGDNGDGKLIIWRFIFYCITVICSINTCLYRIAHRRREGGEWRRWKCSGFGGGIGWGKR